MSSDAAISVVGLSKCYTVYNAPQDRLKQAIMPRLAANNLVRIQQMADRKAVQARAIAYYEEIASRARRRSRAALADQSKEFTSLGPAPADRPAS